MLTKEMTLKCLSKITCLLTPQFIGTVSNTDRSYRAVGTLAADTLFVLGILQRGSPHMDGVPGVTQVGIRRRLAAVCSDYVDDW